ncbi:MAG: YbhB/YbcL family Raf kinase inhibitor-like protein [Anaerolineales bacterium]|nr:YbhB/YbcL family Raf kinase inhibitor-like protein [Anaerolineales bacterium]
MKKLLIPVLAFMLLLPACGTPPATPQASETPAATDAPQTEAPAPGTEAPTDPPGIEAPMPFQLTRPVFSAGEAIPERYTCDGLDISPELTWGDAPEGARSLALIMDDPDSPGGTWVHWVLFNLSPDLRGLGENIHQGTEFNGTPPTIGTNSWGKPAYGGPCPPSGEHRYFFKVYALDAILNLAADSTKADLEKAMDGHILAETELMGVFSR